MVDLDAYFGRIGFTGPRVASYETLAALHALHPAAIPFENLDPLLGNRVALDLAALQAKLVARRRGGYCFEHNTLLGNVLEALGYRVTALCARVMLGAAPDAPPSGRSHMLLMVELDGGAYLVDVGFGGYVATEPLRMLPEIEQPCAGGPMRLLPFDGALTLQARFDDVWRDLYRFTLEPHFAADFEIANWFTSTHPQSLFRNHLVIERATPEVRISAVDRRVRRWFAHGRVEEFTIADAAGLAAVLTADFGLEPPVDAATIFARLPAERA